MEGQAEGGDAFFLEYKTHNRDPQKVRIEPGTGLISQFIGDIMQGAGVELNESQLNEVTHKLESLAKAERKAIQERADSLVLQSKENAANLDVQLKNINLVAENFKSQKDNLIKLLKTRCGAIKKRVSASLSAKVVDVNLKNEHTAVYTIEVHAIGSESPLIFSAGDKVEFHKAQEEVPFRNRKIYVD